MIPSNNHQFSTSLNVADRAEYSLGASSDPIYQMIVRTLRKRDSHTGVLIDVGCGHGKLWSFISNDSVQLKLNFHRYIGVDAVRYDNLPPEIEFIPFNLDIGQAPLLDNVADIVCAVETIEHLENPRAFVRELVRLTRPGGLIIVTTPNQLSLLSKLTLIFKNQFNAFQEAPGLYPAHITALLEVDLVRIFTECGLSNIEIDYTNSGRIPFTSWHWPKYLGLGGRTFSENLLCVGQKPKFL